MTPDGARRQRILDSNRRWRAGFLVLAVVVPTALFALFRRQERRISPDAAGRAVAALLLAAVLVSGFDPEVRAVQAALMGAAPLGVPAVVWGFVIPAVLFSPFFWVLPHLMRIVVSAQARGGGFSKLGIAVAVATAPADLRRSRAIVVGGFVYFVAVVGGWIALAASRGV